MVSSLDANNGVKRCAKDHAATWGKVSFASKLASVSRGLLLCGVSSLVLSVQAGVERDQAKKIHDRLAGVPPSEAVLDAMEAAIVTNDAGQGLQNAAYLAMENPAFYAATLKNLVAPWTNRDQDVFVPLNDYIATYIGLVRDQADFREILHGNVVYVSSSGPAYSADNNENYEHIEANNVDMGLDASGNPIDLVRSTQTAEALLTDAATTAGVMTSRAGARAFFIDGTNRAMFRYTMMNHLCYDMEQVKDTTRPADRIRQDISRSPGGDSRLYLNGCVGCHSGMDPMAQAFAYYQWDYSTDPDDGMLVYTQDVVQPKYFINSTTFPQGYVTPDDSWDNFWRAGANEKLLDFTVNDSEALPAGIQDLQSVPATGQWSPGKGRGAKSLGWELANSEAFARCHVQHAFKTTCLREPATANDVSHVDATVTTFKSSNYNMKQVFAETASYCASN